jgi:arylsulfatase A-like enzyme
MRTRLVLASAAFALLFFVALVAYWGACHFGDPDARAIERLGTIEGSGETRPNVILIVLDTTRADHLGVYGHEPEPTPFLSSLARQSAVFDRAFSVSSWTAPATASVFTGQYPWKHGVLDGFYWHRKQITKAKATNAPVMAINSFASDTRTMPERFRDLGYATVGLASNINIGSEIGFDRGFDRFIRDNANKHGGVRGGLGAAAELVEDTFCSALGVNGFRPYVGTARDFRARLDDWEAELEAAAPYFLYLHLNDAHQPYVRRYPYFRGAVDVSGDPAQQRIENHRANYESEISYMDAQIEKIFHMAFRDDNTLFVVLSDHGEEFGDHGKVGHMRGLYSELNRVVMTIHGPGQGIRAARIADVNVSLIDVLPTLLDLVGAPVPTGMDGRSLVPLLRGDAHAVPLKQELSRRVLFAHRRGAGEWLAAVDGPWKLIRGKGEPSQLFNLQTDPLESTNLFSQEEAIANRLNALLVPFDDESFWKRGDVSTVEAGKALEEQLRALGYVQ